jgi:eukaryotic-like serine/threonine-protein kinase
MSQVTAGHSTPGREPLMFGRYRLLGRLAAGGMAEVWAAQLLATGGFCKSMVIKRVLPELAENETFLRMLMSEARVAARLSHANICSVFELGNVDGEYYIAMEYLRGAPLMELLRTGPLTPELAVSILTGACDGLHYAHEQRDSSGQLLGLIHRDVSPHNLFVTVDGVVKVLDFGIAKVDDGQSDRTEAGKVKGKLPYMSPEQLAAEDLDRRSDVWSLGVVLWECLAGRRLFGGASPAFAVDAIRNANVPSLASLGVHAPGFDDVLSRALCRQREWRYATAAELRRAMLEALLPKLPAAPDALAHLVWDRAGDKVRSHDRLFEDEDGTEPTLDDVVRRLPLRAEATEPSLELVLGEAELVAPGAIAPGDGAVAGARTAIAPVATSPEIEPPAAIAADAAAAAADEVPRGRRRPGPWLIGAGVLVAAAATLIIAGGGHGSGGSSSAVDPATPAVAGGGPPSARTATAHPAAPAHATAPAHPAAPARHAAEPDRHAAEPDRHAAEPDRAAPAHVAAPDHAAPAHVAAPHRATEPAHHAAPDHATEPAEPTHHATAHHATTHHAHPHPTRTAAAETHAAAPALARPGHLSIDAQPWATIYVDGKKLGVTPIVGASLPAGDHSVKAIAQDGKSRSFHVRVEPGGNVRKRVTW